MVTHKTAIAFDFETTGLLKPKIRDLSYQPYIIEYCFKKVVIEGKSVEEVDIMSGFLKPPIPLPPIIKKITGIVDADLVNAPVFIDVVDKIQKFFIGTEIAIAHNLPFDKGVLSNELLRLDKLLNFPWPPIQICTVESTLKLKGYRLSLEKLHALLFDGQSFNSHRAVDDVNALTLCFTELLNRNCIKLPSIF